jgi:putative transposase
VPRDRNRSFDPAGAEAETPPRFERRHDLEPLCPRHTIRDIKAHLAEVYGVEVSHETVANVTEVVVEEVGAWQFRRSMRCIRSCSSRHPDRPST